LDLVCGEHGLAGGVAVLMRSAVDAAHGAGIGEGEAEVADASSEAVGEVGMRLHVGARSNRVWRGGAVELVDDGPSHRSSIVALRRGAAAGLRDSIRAGLYRYR